MKTAYATIKGIGDACTTQASLSIFIIVITGEMRTGKQDFEKCKAF